MSISRKCSTIKLNKKGLRSLNPWWLGNIKMRILCVHKFRKWCRKLIVRESWVLSFQRSWPYGNTRIELWNSSTNQPLPVLTKDNQPIPQANHAFIFDTQHGQLKRSSIKLFVASKRNYWPQRVPYLADWCCEDKTCAPKDIIMTETCSALMIWTTLESSLTMKDFDKSLRNATRNFLSMSTLMASQFTPLCNNKHE